MGLFNFFSNDYSNYREEALIEYHTSNYPKAITLFTKAIEKEPNNCELYIMRGTSYEDSSNDSKAKEDFEKALSISPNNYLANFRLGMVYFRMKNWQLSAQFLKKGAINHTNKDTTKKNTIDYVAKQIILQNLGSAYVFLNDNVEAEKCFIEALKEDPNYSFSNFSLGVILIQRGKTEEGINLLKKAAKLGHPQASAVLAQIGINNADSFNPDNCSYNPYRITANSALNQIGNMPDFSATFYKELDSLRYTGTPKEIIIRYTISMIQSYYENAGYTPVIFLNGLFKQIAAASKLAFGDAFSNAEILRKEVYSRILRN